MRRVPRPDLVHQATSTRSLFPMVSTDGWGTVSLSEYLQQRLKPTGAHKQKSSAELIQAVWQFEESLFPVPQLLTPL